jgi:outer membrane lipoprotein LolB
LSPPVVERLQPFHLLFLIIIILLNGCASTANNHESKISNTDAAREYRDAQWNELQQSNLNIQSWSLKGKIGVKSGSKGGSATLNWDYQNATQNIELYGPFGGGRVHITANEDSATLKDTKGKIIQGRSAQDVLFQRLGWHIPFEELILWSRGLPNEGATDIVTDSSGRLQSLNQGVWHVEYLEHRTINNYTLPRKLTISSLPGTLEVYDDDGNNLGDQLTVKIIFKRWWDIKPD